MFNDPTIVWLLLSYLTGSAATFFLVYRSILTRSVGDTIDSLMDQGYIKFKRLPNGDVEILKWNSND